MNNKRTPSWNLLGDERWLSTNPYLRDLIDTLSDAMSGDYSKASGLHLANLTTELYFYDEVSAKTLAKCEEYAQRWLNRVDQHIETT